MTSLQLCSPNTVTCDLSCGLTMVSTQLNCTHKYIFVGNITASGLSFNSNFCGWVQAHIQGQTVERLWAGLIKEENLSCTHDTHIIFK